MIKDEVFSYSQLLIILQSLYTNQMHFLLKNEKTAWLVDHYVY